MSQVTHGPTPLPSFRPLPLLGNSHVQTLLGTLWKGRLPELAATERLVGLPDGDRLVAHISVPPSWQPGGWTALLVHGLSGSHQSSYLLRLGSVLFSRGIRIVRLDLRGAGRGEPHARKTYNGGCSDDVRAVLDELRHDDPGGRLIAIGFSLGGNIILKLAGEATSRPVPGLECVAALAPPIDLERCSAMLAERRNWLYDQHFARALVKQALRQQRYFPDEPPIRFPRRMTLRLFDELYTAPRGGYRDALDYYRRASSGPLIARIGLPAFIMTAVDDPFVAIEPFRHLNLPGNIEMHLIPKGGHLGFLGRDGTGGIRWAERQLANWVLSTLPRLPRPSAAAH